MFSNDSEKMFRILVEYGQEGISIANREGEILYRNPAAERLTGYTLEEVKGKKFTEMIHPDDRDATIAFYNELLREPGIAKPKMHRVLHKDGYYIWTEGTMINLLDHADFQGILSNFHDITERKKAEDELRKSELRYRSLIDQASDAIMITDNKGNFADVILALCKVFG